MTESERQAFLIEIHRAIESEAEGRAYDLVVGTPDDVTYPPNGGFTDEELEALGQLASLRSAALRSGLRKVFADIGAGVAFSMLSLIDGVASPAGCEDWGVFSIKPREEDEIEDMLHDELYATYWDWRDIRKKPWRLDLLEE